MSLKSITNTYVLTLFVLVVLLITRHNELRALITGQNCPESSSVDELARNTGRFKFKIKIQIAVSNLASAKTFTKFNSNKERVAENENLYIYDSLDDSGSGEELEQERLALENDSDEPPTEESQIIKGFVRFVSLATHH